jgi:hypothetical protein
VTNLLTRAVTLRYETPAGVDGDGQPTVTASTVDATCYATQARASIDDGVRIATDELRVYLAPGVALDHLVGIELDGLTYDLATVPRAQHNPRTRVVEYVAFNVRRAVS